MQNWELPGVVFVRPKTLWSRQIEAQVKSGNELMTEVWKKDPFFQTLTTKTPQPKTATLSVILSPDKGAYPENVPVLLCNIV